MFVYWLILSRLPYGVLPDHLKVDVDALPTELRLRPGILQRLLAIFFLLLGGLLIVLALTTGDGVVVVFFAGGAMVYLGANRLLRVFRYSRNVIFTPENAKIRWSGTKTSIVPYGEYIAVRKTAVVFQVTSDRPQVYFNYLIDLVHPEPRLCVPLFITYQSENVEPELQAYAHHFNLPIWRQSVDGYDVQNLEGVNTPYVDRIYAEAGNVTPSNLAPPPQGISVELTLDADGEEITNIQIQQRWYAYWGVRAFLLFAVLLLHGFATHISVYFSLALMLMTAPFLIWGLSTTKQKCERVTLKAGVLLAQEMSCSKKNGVKKEWQVHLSSIDSIVLSPRYDKHAGLMILSGSVANYFGRTTNIAGRKWLNNFIIEYIRSRYQPDEECAVSDVKTSTGE